MSEKVKGILGIFLLVGFLVGGIQSCTHEHDWIDATCTEPKTCSICKKTEGDPLGRDWEDATCLAPKTCSVCGETEGDPVSHYSLQRVTTIEPTCQAEGEKTFTCYYCGEICTETIPTIDHKAGNSVSNT